MKFDLGDTEYTAGLLLAVFLINALLAWWFVPIDGLIVAVVATFIMSLLVFPLALPVYFLQGLALHIFLYLLGQIYEKTVLAQRQAFGLAERLMEDPGQQGPAQAEIHQRQPKKSCTAFCNRL